MSGDVELTISFHPVLQLRNTDNHFLRGEPNQYVNILALEAGTVKTTSQPQRVQNGW